MVAAFWRQALSMINNKTDAWKTDVNLLIGAEATEANNSLIIHHSSSMRCLLFYVPVNSKTAHPQPPGNPRAFNSC